MDKDKESPPSTLKIISGILLLATFFMPIASCTRSVPHPSQEELYEQKLNGQNVTIEIVKIGKTELYYPNKAFRINNLDSWKEILGFVWPLPLIGLQILLRKKARVLILSFLGLGLSLWSMIVIFVDIAMFRKLLWPGYLAGAAVGCLFLLYLVEVTLPSWKFIKAKIRLHKTANS